MNKIQVLDCTLRDGGYCNCWNFGEENIIKIVKGLCEANIDIVECGFLTGLSSYKKGRTKYTDLGQLEAVIPQEKRGKCFVAMINEGEYDPEKLPYCDGKTVDGIRLAFHKDHMEQALRQCEIIKSKGYKLFLQPMVSLNYTDEEFIRLIYRANLLQPHAFYIVDSFGMMKQKNLIRLFYLVDNNLDKNICIGFHSHNNLQLAYSNAQYLVSISSGHSLIIDSSVYGMGRGAGNLNTELFLEYLNENIDAGYVLEPLLDIIDEILNDFYQKKPWGYSLPNYLSAIHNVHPGYAGFLDDKKTLTVKEMNEIFLMMEDNKRNSFDREYMDALYLEYMERGSSGAGRKHEFAKLLESKKVLLVAPGKSSTEEREKILGFVRENDAVAISINFQYEYLPDTYIFVSNLRRYREMQDSDMSRCIITSNIKAERSYFQTEYKELLNDVESVYDNAGLMAIRFLMVYGVREIYLAGFDGYSHSYQDNYGNDRLAFVSNTEVLDNMNEGMASVLEEYAKRVKIEFLTTPRMIHIGGNDEN